MKKSWFIAWFLMLITLAFSLNYGIAQESNEGIELSPPMKDLVMDPGREETFEVTLGNPNNRKTMNLRVGVSAIIQELSGSYSVTNENSSLSAAPWLDVKQEKLSLPPNGMATVPVKVKIPRNGFGSRVAAVIFDVVQDDPKNSSAGLGGSTTFIHRLTTIIKITVNSRANRKQASINKLSVVDPVVDKRFVSYGKKTTAVLCTVANEGNTLIAAQGYLIIRNLAGRRMMEAPLGSGRGIILPGAKVELTSIFPKGFPDGEYTAEVTIPFGGSRPLQAKIPFQIKRAIIEKGNLQLLNTVRLIASPEKFETQLPGGAFRTFILNLANDEKYPLKVRGYLRDVSTGTEGELIPVEGNTPPYSAMGWLKLEQDDLVLPPGEKKTFRITTMLPKDIIDGTRYAAVVLEAERAETKQKGAVTNIITPIVITVGKKINRKAEITNLQVFKDPSGKWIVGGSLINRGNTHFGLSGKLILRRPAQKTNQQDGLKILSKVKWDDFVTLPLVESPGWILPGEVRPIFAIYEEELEIGEYQAEFEVDYGEKSPVITSFIFKLDSK